MRVLPIRLNTSQEVKSFVDIMNCFPYDVDLRSGRCIVDAKSILGIFSLDLSRPLTLIVYNDRCDDLIAKIQPLMI